MPDEMPSLDGLLDALADRIAAKLGGGPVAGPSGEPLPGLPDLPQVDPDRPWLHSSTRLALQGIELTQSIQHYKTGYGPDNSVPIVALKPMVVRAYPYVAPGLLGHDPLSGQIVTGELVLSRWGKEVYRTGPTRQPGARVGRESRLNRNLWDREDTLFVSSGSGPAAGIRLITWNASLNFYIPAWYLRAEQSSVAVRLWLTTGQGGIATADRMFRPLQVDVPKIAMVRVNWKDPVTGAIASPTDADMYGLADLAQPMLPFPYYETTILDVEETKSGDFSGPPATKGGCNMAWSNLLTGLKLTRIFTALFQLGDIVFGVVPWEGALTTSGDQNTGCGWTDDGVGGCMAGDVLSFAHEIGHLYGCGHIGDPGLESYDPGYPNYGGSPTSIGEVGINTSLSPMRLRDATFNDLMSYEFPQWISPYSYKKILAYRHNHQSKPADPRRVRPFLILAFDDVRLVDGDRHIDKLKAHLVEAPGSVPKRGRATDQSWSIDLLDGQGRILATHHCTLPEGLGSGCGCGTRHVDRAREPLLSYVEAIDWPAEVAGLSFHKGGAPVARFDAGEPPEVEIAVAERRDTAIVLRVAARHASEQPAVAIFFTGNDGERWIPVAIDPPADEPVVVDLAKLPGGPRCRFRAVATAALRFASAETETFELPLTGRSLAIAVREQPCGQGRIDLSAHIDSRGLGAVDPGEILWRSAEGEIARGYRETVELPPGRHRISVEAPDGIGGMLHRAVTLVIDSGQ